VDGRREGCRRTPASRRGDGRAADADDGGREDSASGGGIGVPGEPCCAQGLGGDDDGAAARAPVGGLLLQEPGGEDETGRKAGGGLFEGGTAVRDALLSWLLTVISRTLLLRDRLTGRMARLKAASPAEMTQLRISSGSRSLSAVHISAGDGSPVILICHGIGERVEYWGQAQGLLREMGVSSLVFDYSGYGDSSGTVSAAHCEEDAISAYRHLLLADLLPKDRGSVFLLGFSLGSGVAASIASRVEVDGLILCQGFSSLREAAASVGCPRWTTSAAPDIWRTVDRMSGIDLPVLVIHGDMDGLFPASMAERVAAACGDRGELKIIRGVDHNAPIFTPTREYWEPVAIWVKAKSYRAAAADNAIPQG
jgi:uncharacterized protein